MSSKENNTEKIWSIYMHIFPNGKRYIGITSKSPPSKRWGKNGRCYKKQPRLWNAIQKYGWDNIVHRIVLTNETYEYACRVEKCLIKHFQTRDKKHGYNLTDGGEGSVGYVPTEETRKKIGDSVRGKLKGVPKSEEHKQNLSKAFMGRTPWNKNIPFSEQAKINMSKAHKGKYLGIENPNYNNHDAIAGLRNVGSKPVYSPELNRFFWGAREVENILSISGTHITACCNGRRKHAGRHPDTNEQLTWRYASEDEVKMLYPNKRLVGESKDDYNKRVSELNINTKQNDLETKEAI